MYLKLIVVPKSNKHCEVRCLAQPTHLSLYWNSNFPNYIYSNTSKTLISPHSSSVFHDDGVLQLFCIDTVAFLLFLGACLTPNTLSFYGVPKTPIRLRTGVIHMSQTLVSCICPTDSFSMLYNNNKVNHLDKKGLMIINFNLDSDIITHWQCVIKNIKILTVHCLSSNDDGGF